jgi:hypothetical protein
MDDYAKQQAIAFDKWKVENGWEWSTAKWYSHREVFWVQIPYGEYLTPEQLYDLFIEANPQ